MVQVGAVGRGGVGGTGEHGRGGAWRDGGERVRGRWKGLRLRGGVEEGAMRRWVA